MPDLIQVAARIFNRPLAVEPAYAKTFFSAIAPRLDIIQVRTPEGELILGEKLREKASSYTADRERSRPYQFHRGVAVLPVAGTLVHKHGYLQPYSGMTGYDGVVARVSAAMADPEVKGVLLDIDSHGGEVSGCFDATDTVKRLGSEKPVWSLCYDSACSAAFALASAAERRLITQAGRTGSVGVVMAHVSHARELAEQGRKVTLVYSGEHKAEGNPYEDLSEDTLKKFQQEIDAMRQEFATLIAANLGLDIQAVLDTEAAVYRSQAALDTGFADQRINGHEAADEFADYLNRPTTNTGALPMATQEQPKVVAALTAARTEETNDDAIPEKEPEKASPADDNQTGNTDDQAAAERVRVGAILKSAEAQGRQNLANHLAFNTALTVDEAKATLAEAAEEAAGTSQLDAAMAKEDQPNIGADAGGDVSDADRMMGHYRLATGNAKK